MAAITDLSDLVNRLTGGNSGTPEHLYFWKDARVSGAAAAATVAGRMTSLWQYEGQPSHGAAATSTGAALDNTTQGGLKQTDPSGGRSKWLLGASAVSSGIGTLVIYDRLAQDGGLSGTSGSAQTISFTPPSRYSSGIGNQIWIEIDTQIGASSTTISASYEDQSGSGSANSTSTSVAIGGTGLREAQRIIPLNLAAGDTGVKNVASVTLAATTGTVGSFAVVLAHPICLIPVTQTGIGIPRDFITGEPGIIEIQTDACLAMAWIANSATAPQVMGDLHMIEA